MLQHQPMEDPAADESQKANDDHLPLGVRLTARFLDILSVLLGLLAFGGMVICIQSLGNVAHEPEEVWFAIGKSLLALAGLLAVVSMMTSATWLAMIIRARHALDPDRARWPEHPKFSMLHPLLLTAQAYAAVALLVWIFVKLVRHWETSWTWMGFWLVITLAGEFSMRSMGRKGLPW